MIYQYVSVYTKNTVNTIEPYSKNNISRYSKLWKKAFDDTMKQLQTSDREFANFYTANRVNGITYDFSELKKDYESHLNALPSKLDGQQIGNMLCQLTKCFKDCIMQNIESALNVPFDCHTKTVLEQYYATTAEKDWDNTIFLIEVLKAVYAVQKNISEGQKP